MDGFLDKRSRFGRWDRRYVRTELYNLLYFSEGLDIIEQTRDVGAAQIQRNGGARGGPARPPPAAALLHHGSNLGHRALRCSPRRALGRSQAPVADPRGGRRAPARS